MLFPDAPNPPTSMLMQEAHMEKILMAAVVALSLGAAASAQALHFVHLHILKERVGAKSSLQGWAASRPDPLGVTPRRLRSNEPASSPQRNASSRHRQRAALNRPAD
jgi:hypothetical protein